MAFLHLHIEAERTILLLRLLSTFVGLLSGVLCGSVSSLTSSLISSSNLIGNGLGYGTQKGVIIHSWIFVGGPRSFATSVGPIDEDPATGGEGANSPGTVQYLE